MAKILLLALQRRRYDLAAHVLVYGLIKARLELEDHGRKRERKQREGKA
jgi:hypothetical protein